MIARVSLERTGELRVSLERLFLFSATRAFSFVRLSLARASSSDAGAVRDGFKGVNTRV